MRRCGLTGLALALLLGGGVLADEKKADEKEAVKQEHKRLKGTWEAVRAVADGKEEPFPEGKLTLTLKDGKFTFKEGDKLVGNGTFKIDPTTSPRSMDLIPDSGRRVIFLAIYEVKGATLRVCWAPPGKPRPKAFESREGSGHTLDTCKRVKSKD